MNSKNEWAANRDSEGIVYCFADGTTQVIRLEDYLLENPEYTAEDFRRIKEASDASSRMSCTAIKRLIQTLTPLQPCCLRQTRNRVSKSCIGNSADWLCGQHLPSYTAVRCPLCKGSGLLPISCMGNPFLRSHGKKESTVQVSGADCIELQANYKKRKIVSFRCVPMEHVFLF